MSFLSSFVSHVLRLVNPGRLVDCSAPLLFQVLCPADLFTKGFLSILRNVHWRRDKATRSERHLSVLIGVGGCGVPPWSQGGGSLQVGQEANGTIADLGLIK